ncbi:MAG TPA: FtsW/RodA/SpoVE family cell cycle protein [Blastocatellia bacterium]|nr:FtsW/RodA/SpoVE family cell cycle protein [Blastocatellia bacterium]
MAAPILLGALGCLGIYSTAPGTDLWKKQLVFLVLGIAFSLALAFTDYRKILVLIAPFFYLGVILMLVMVLVGFGVKVNGNTSWLKLPGGIRFQPSEFAKLAVILMLARQVAQVNDKKNAGEDKPLSLRDIVIMGLIVLPPVLLVRLENDTGTMLTFGAILATFYFMAGMRKIMLLGGVVFVAVGLVAVYPHLKGYQKERIKAVIEPDKVDPRGFGYQTIQSVIAVGSGGALGKGLSNGTQGRLGFLPYAYSDFIGAALAEETGLAGILFLMLLYLLLIWRLIAVARVARDRAGALMIMGLVGLLTFHIACNLGMVVGLMPTIGIPLPLMSQGGTAVLSIFAGIGLALSVRVKRFVN